MADDLKRVGLVFKSDGSTDFVKSLKLVNAELKSNYENFKLTQAQWDKSTTSTQKLKDKLVYLNEAYDIQESKVRTLKDQLESLENAENRDEVAIQKKKAALTQAEASLQRYKNQIDETNNKLKTSSEAIKEFGKKIEEKGNKIEGAGRKLSAFSTATLAALTASARGAIEFEDAFVGVEKTVDGTSGQMEELKQGIRNMAKEIPASTTEISAVAEAAGQLGIKTEDILSFTRVMIDLGNSTNLSAEEAASALAKFANITNMSASNYSNLGSVIVALGNNFATTEADIVSMATRLAATGELTGLTQPQIMALATAMSSVGVEAEAGGSAMSKLLKQMQVATETGSKKLDKFAKVAGMTSKEFKQAFQKDAVKALSAFISGLNNTERNGKSAVAVLDDMGLTEVRLSNTILSLANSSGLMNDAIDLANKSWEENTALTNEASKRYGDLKSKLQIALQQIQDIGITLGTKLMPSIEKVITKVGEWANKFDQLDEKQVDMIVKLGLLVTAAAPVISTFGKMVTGVGQVVGAYGNFREGLGALITKAESSNVAVKGMLSVIEGITGPVGLACIAVGALSAAVTYFATKETDAQKEIRLFSEEMANSKKSFDEYKKGIDDTTQKNLAQISSVGKLKEELKTLVDENGRVKEGYEGRVSFILNELNSALGTEYTLNDNVVQSYKQLQSEIDGTIEKKKAEIILNSEQQKWAKAKETEIQAVENLKQAQEQLNSKMSEYGLSYDELKQKAQTYYDMANNQWITGGNKIAIEMYTKEGDSIQNVINAYEDASSVVKQCTEDKKLYENDYALFVEGKYNEIGTTIRDTTQSWTQSSLQEIQNSIQQQQAALEVYKQIYEQTGNEVAQQQMLQAEQNLQNLINELTTRTTTVGELGQEEIAAWKTVADTSYERYFDTISKMPPDLAQKIQQMTGVTAEKTPGLVNQTHSMAQQVLDQIEKNPEFRQEAINNLQGMLNGLEDGQLRQLLNNAGVQDADKVIQGIRSGNLAEDAGMQILNSLKSGLDNSRWQNSLFSVARGIASTLSGLLTVKANVNGNISKLPGHKSGLDYVPKDNYVARLHKGERVLTKEENKDYTEAEKQSKKHRVSTIAKNQKEETISKDIDYEKLFKIFLKALNSCKIKLDKDGFVKFIDDRLLEVM